MNYLLLRALAQWGPDLGRDVEVLLQYKQQDLMKLYAPNRNVELSHVLLNNFPHSCTLLGVPPHCPSTQTKARLQNTRDAIQYLCFSQARLISFFFFATEAVERVVGWGEAERKKKRVGHFGDAKQE